MSYLIYISIEQSIDLICIVDPQVVESLNAFSIYSKVSALN
jgi:hypothetical protein